MVEIKSNASNSQQIYYSQNMEKKLKIGHDGRSLNRSSRIFIRRAADSA